jgi:glucosamine 6-phosphate synthetase-like amidotransferase/phosphosugar isomerase protein
MNVSAANMQEGDLAIGISHSGRTKPVVDAMRQAKSMGAETVAITSYSSSILSRESDYAIIVYPDEENYPVEAVSARVAHLCVVDALMMTLATMKHDDFAEHIASCGFSSVDNLINLAYENKIMPHEYPVVKAYEMLSCFEGLLELYRDTGTEKYLIAVKNFAAALIKN